MTKPILVSVCCISYNQEKFIKDALEGFVMQKTNFAFEVIVSDDKSTDGTRKIITEYAEKYPDIIKPVFHKKNVGSLNNFRDNFSRATGKYIAMCEGDDFWTDPHKLQVQVDFMEKNTDYALSFHPVTVHYEDAHLKDFVYPATTTDFTLDRLLGENFIQTNSVMYRRLPNYDIAQTDFVPGDWYLHLYHARFGKIGFINTVMSVYRRHEGGIWANESHKLHAFWNKYAMQHLEFCKQVLLLFPDDTASREKILLLSARLLYEVNNAEPDLRSPLYQRIIDTYPEFAIEYVAFLRKIIDEKNAQLASVLHVKIKHLAKKVARKVIRNPDTLRYIKTKLRSDNK